MQQYYAMTKLCLALLCLALLCLALLTAVFVLEYPLAAAPPAAPDHAAIQAAYQGLGASFQAHDLDRFMAYFSPDYIDVDENGRHLTKEQTRQGYKDQLGQMKSIQSRYVLRNVAATPAGIVVEMRMHSSGTGEKRILFVKVRGHFTDDLWVRDLWVSTPQGWRLQRRQTLEDTLHTGR